MGFHAFSLVLRQCLRPERKLFAQKPETSFYKSVVTKACRWWRAGLLPVLLPAVTMAQTGAWTLESAIRRAMEIAPEMRAADANVQAIQGELTQAGALANPSMSRRAGGSLRRE